LHFAINDLKINFIATYNSSRFKILLSIYKVGLQSRYTKKIDFSVIQKERRMQLFTAAAPHWAVA
jgi:hypothetical protein